MAIPFTLNGRLVSAVAREDVKSVNTLLEKGASPDARSVDRGLHVLKIAVENEFCTIAMALVRAGASQSLALNNKSVLTYAVKNNKHKILAAAITGKLDLDQMDQEGELPLNLAIKEMNATAISALIRAGANPQLQDGLGVTAHELARQKDLAHIFMPSRPSPEEDRKAVTENALEKNEQWKVLARTRICHVTNDPDIGQRLTDIFNFTTRERITTVLDLDRNVQSTVLTPFDAMPDKDVITSAFEQLQALGGTADPTAIYGAARNKQPLIPERKK